MAKSLSLTAALIEDHGGIFSFLRKLENCLDRNDFGLSEGLEYLGFSSNMADKYSSDDGYKIPDIKDNIKQEILKFYDKYEKNKDRRQNVFKRFRDSQASKEQVLYTNILNKQIRNWEKINDLKNKVRYETISKILEDAPELTNVLLSKAKRGDSKLLVHSLDLILKWEPNLDLTNDQRYLELDNKDYDDISLIMLPNRDSGSVLEYNLINEHDYLLSKIEKTRLIKPVSRKQESFLKSEADIAIYGGAAGGGKTFALLLEFLYYYKIANFHGVIIRKNTTQIKQGGGLWDVATELYSKLKAKFNLTLNQVSFDKYKSRLDFKYLQRESEIYDWQGAQYPLICFDELTHFSKKQFFYLLTRNRNLLGLQSKIRATCNPEKESWLRELIDWWIDDNGYPIESRSGVLRYLVHYEDSYNWFSSFEDAKKEFPRQVPKSVTFINANIYDNPVLLNSDPGYLASLEGSNKLFKERLLKGNWNIVASAGSYFKRTDFQILQATKESLKSVIIKKVRAWDFANSEPTEINPDPDYTVGLLLGLTNDGYYYVMDMKRVRYRMSEVHKLIKTVAETDGSDVIIRIPEDPGSSGRGNVEAIKKLLKGFIVKSDRVTKNKEVRALRPSTQSGIGLFKLLKDYWNDDFLNELEAFPTKGRHDDIVDALSDAFDELCKDNQNKVNIVDKPRIIL